MSQKEPLYLQPTAMLDYGHPSVQRLVRQQGWREMPEPEGTRAIYLFVRDQIQFGYNASDDLSASKVLADGYGQCNTKGTLLMALLRAVGIPARLHGFTIYNELQRGAIPDYLFGLAPDQIIHSWVEARVGGRWLELEGYIIDQRYLGQVQKRFTDHRGPFYGFGIAASCLSSPDNEWTGGNTYIQKLGIARDFGRYQQPDQFYRERGSNLSGWRRWAFRYVIRHLINLNVRRIRRGSGLPGTRFG
ncbi:transglutaminase-like domain-containing protein [Marinobacter sp. CA1]|uniref:transglutaminase-like domain-containing protein n=1 Tax=Marinobacter sp. CA1 TaxID=2817656 RepID=UPI001D06CCD4|nr:transglutaminase-like domain-containing protein [Marinobacter sp. CA1]UDL03374.1 transglutaminase domain-containing protein [Marinobacter sp. CA1]